jgi:hypothetical protein
MEEENAIGVRPKIRLVAIFRISDDWPFPGKGGADQGTGSWQKSPAGG